MENILKRLSLREKIGQMLMFDFRKWQNSDEDKQSDYTVMSDEVKGMIQRNKLGNVILFAENFESVEQITRLKHRYIVFYTKLYKKLQKFFGKGHIHIRKTKVFTPFSGYKFIL